MIMQNTEHTPDPELITTAAPKATVEPVKATEPAKATEPVKATESAKATEPVKVPVTVASAPKKRKIPAIGAELVAEALRQAGRPTLTRTDVARDIEAFLSPDPDGPGLLLKIERNARARSRAVMLNGQSEQSERSIRDQQEAVKAHLDLLKEEYKAGKEDYKKGLIQDFEMEMIKEAYESNVANVKNSLDARLESVEIAPSLDVPELETYSFVINETDAGSFLANADIEG